MTDARSVIVTGAASEVGAAVATAFARAGDRVFAADLSWDGLAQLVESIGSELIQGRVLDVADADAVQELVGSVVAQTGRADVLVSNAGVFDGAASISETERDLWDKIIRIDLTGCFNCAKAVSEQMIAQQSGRIINLSAVAAQRALPDGIAYCAAKAGIEGLTSRLAFDLGEYGVTANVVAPGAIHTSARITSEEILGAIADKRLTVGASPEQINLLIPMRRAGLPSEIAATVFFLASEAAAHINGEVISVVGRWERRLNRPIPESVQVESSVHD